MKKAIVFGATGLIGEELIQLLKNSMYDEVFIVVRKASPVLLKFQQDNPQLFKLRELADLFSFAFNSETDGDFQGSDIFCTLGTTIKTAKTKENFKRIDYDLVLSLLKKAKEMKASHLVLVSSVGANPKSKIFYSQIKGEVEEAVREMNFAHYYFLRPSLLLGERSEFRLGEKVMRELAFLYSPLMIGGLSQFRPIKARDVAKCMISLMQGVAEGKPHRSGVIENLELQTMSAALQP